MLVIGGGVVGLSIAWKAASEGLKVSLVSDATRPIASDAAVGGLSFCLPDSVLAGDQAVIELCLAAKKSYPEFITSLEAFSGIETGFRRRPTLMIRHVGESGSALDRIALARESIGLTSQHLSAAECLTREPVLPDSVEEGLLLEDHHQINARALTSSLKSACKIADVALSSDRVSRIIVEAGRAVGVETMSGNRIEAKVVAVAAGTWSGKLLGLPSELVDCVRPVSGQIVLVDAGSEVPVPQHDLRTGGVYIVARSDNTIAVGATKSELGFDALPTLGSAHELAHEALRLWPGVAECRWLETTVGMRPKSADGLPLIGATSIPGVIAATGHFKNGVMFAALTADVVVDVIKNRRIVECFDAFSPKRLCAHV